MREIVPLSEKIKVCLSRFSFEYSCVNKAESRVLMTCNACGDVGNKKISMVFKQVSSGKTCCRKCNTVGDNLDKIKNKIKNTCLERFGVDNAYKSSEIKEKIKKTCIEKYGAENPSKNKDVYNKIKKTCMEKYGVDSYAKTKEYKERVEKTNLNKFGTKAPAQNQDIKNKIKKTSLEKYGVESYSYLPEFKDKCRKTSIEKYGTEFPMKNENIKNKAVDAVIKKYGCRSTSQVPEIALKQAKSCNNSSILRRWSDGEEIVCVGSYEVKCVEFFNKYKINFIWQIPFKLPNKKVYFCDAYLPETDTYVEIKGMWRKDALEKFQQFQSITESNVEVWDRAVLKKMEIL